MAKPVAGKGGKVTFGTPMGEITFDLIAEVLSRKVLGDVVACREPNVQVLLEQAIAELVKFTKGGLKKEEQADG